MKINTKKLVENLFKDKQGKPIVLTPSQKEIFDLIFFKKYPYNQIIAFTRYGKSFVTALAVLTRCAFKPEKWAIIAPTEKHAKIVMNYVIEHIFDNEFFLKKLQLEEGETLERLRRERSKRRITLKIFKNDSFSEIFILSAFSTKEDPLKSLLGFGAENIILDESSLIDDKVYAGVLRMLGDSPNPFLLEIGNPLKKNHFWETFNNPLFRKIVIDYKKGLEEGRITPEQVELMKKQPFFDVLYECKWPSESEIFKREWLKEDKSDLNEIDLVVIGTDLAVSEKESADFSTIVVVGVKKDKKISIRFSKKFKGEMSVFLELVKEVFDYYEKRGKTTILGVEDVGYQRVFGEELARRYAIAPVYVKRVKDKRSRFLVLSTYFQNGQIEFLGEHPELIDELLGYPTGEHDDLIDALEMAVSIAKDYLIVEEEEKQKEEISVVSKKREMLRKLEEEESIEEENLIF